VKTLDSVVTEKEFQSWVHEVRSGPCPLRDRFDVSEKHLEVFHRLHRAFGCRFDVVAIVLGLGLLTPRRVSISRVTPTLS
jgi:hypothetical protein